MLEQSKQFDRLFEGLDETQCDSLIAKLNQEARDRLATIFDDFCDAGRHAKRISDVLHYGGKEPDYNPNTEQLLVIHEKDDRVIIETQMAHQMRYRLKYELRLRDGIWKILDNRKYFSEHHQKWHRMDL